MTYTFKPAEVKGDNASAALSAIVANSVRHNLRGAVVISQRLVERINKPHGYWENAYIVAWEREDQCGTHRVCVNSLGETMCVWGHYDLSKEDALTDARKR